jgi:hypothetical protein
MTIDLEIALEAATAAGKLTLHYFRQRSLKIFTKRDDSPVTEADRQAEKKSSLSFVLSSPKMVSWAKNLAKSPAELDASGLLTLLMAQNHSFMACHSMVS